MPRPPDPALQVIARLRAAALAASSAGASAEPARQRPRAGAPRAPRTDVLALLTHAVDRLRFSDPVLRWRLTSNATKSVVAVLLAGLAWGGWLALRSTPSPAAPVVLPAAAGSIRATPSMLVVDVVGPVLHPGIVRVPPGSRVVDVIRAAGGLRPGATAGTNLARLVADGEQVLLGTPAAQSGSPGTALVDLNTAGLAELDALPRVGPVLAQRIIDWRDSHGRFSSVDELREIAGIGSSVFAEIAKRVRV